MYFRRAGNRLLPGPTGGSPPDSAMRTVFAGFVRSQALTSMSTQRDRAASGEANRIIYRDCAMARSMDGQSCGVAEKARLVDKDAQRATLPPGLAKSLEDLAKPCDEWFVLSPTVGNKSVIKRPRPRRFGGHLFTPMASSNDVSLVGFSDKKKGLVSIRRSGTSLQRPDGRYWISPTPARRL